MKLSPTQLRALTSLSFLVTLNLRLNYTKATIASLERLGLITESDELYPRRCYSLTEAGRQALNLSPSDS